MRIRFARFLVPALLVLLALLALFALLAPLVPHARAEEPQALVVEIASESDPALRGWVLATDLAAPGGAMDAPTDSKSCLIEGMQRLAIWLDSNWAGFDMIDLRCVPAASAVGFIQGAGSLARRLDEARAGTGR